MVYSNSSKYLHRNVCAICNQDFQSMHKFRTQLNCVDPLSSIFDDGNVTRISQVKKYLIPENYHHENFTWEFKFNGKRRIICYLIIDGFSKSNLHGLGNRPCAYPVIGDCPANNPQDVLRKCAAYTARLYGPPGLVEAPIYY